MAFVLDASVAVAWVVSSQATPYTRRIRPRARREPYHVPAIFVPEWLTCSWFWNAAARLAGKRQYNRTHQLADLVAAAEAIEEGKSVPEHILEQLEPGTSMGGARPKATIEDGNRLWVGKFPEKEDRFNLQRVEYATLELARRCGIDVCNSRLESVGGKDVLMVERFDREYTEGGYLRFGLVSGFTMLDADEYYLDRDRWSYPLLADQLRRWSEKPNEDRIELFRRMVFDAAITNNDDHPRNHAVRRTARGWRLTPAYDLVPVPLVRLDRRDLAMTIGTYGRTASVYNLLSQCERFGLRKLCKSPCNSALNIYSESIELRGA